jgi:undecaprenyl phosphate N,N'-diacetylbacillosamine 1-phosphate transferase
VYRVVIKPFFDRLAAGVALLVAAPVLVLAALALAVAQQGHVWFRQERPGRGGKPFRIWKFKTMTDARDARGDLLPDAQRLTAVGKFIRKTSVDELPQLVNVVLGQMSLVGPRPLLMEYLPLYNAEQFRRHEVLPGITGWAQVQGRNTVPWPERFALDVWYVDHQSFSLDLKILFLSVAKVFKAEGISSATAATMEKFRGNK